MRDTFPLARYQFSFCVTAPILLPEYAGSTLRGAFGRALRKIACMTKQDDCKNCPLYQSCPYTNIFETPTPQNYELQKFSQVPNGYIIEPPEWGEKIYQIGEKLEFSLVLFGRLIEQLPLIAFAFRRAFEYNVGRGKAELVDIAKISENQTDCESILVEGNIVEHQKTLYLPDTFNSSITIEIDTPLRLQDNGNPLKPNEVTVERFFITLAKRLILLSEFHDKTLELDFKQIKQDIIQVQDQKNLKWQDWIRYSSRQDQKMKLGGVIGSWKFTQLSPLLCHLLYLGQFIHCGKNTTFGLGKYRITNL